MNKEHINKRRNNQLCGGHLAPYPIVGYLLTFLDYLCRFIPKAAINKGKIKTKEIKNILISNPAHLGDVLIASSVLPALRQKYPTAKIGIVIGEWAVTLVKDMPGIEYVHIVDHWKLNRSPSSRLKKVIRYLSTRKTALNEIKSIKYEIAIDLYLYYPNSSVLFWQADIPVRIGFATGGFGSLFTHLASWEAYDNHIIHQYQKLFAHLDIAPEWLANARPVIKTGTAVQSSLVNRSKPYRLIIHPGSGDPRKRWMPESWRELITELIATGRFEIFCTGASAEEAEQIDELIHNVPFCTNLSQKLLWTEFVNLISSADLLIGVDSVAGHVASALQTPCIIIAAAMGNPSHWRPLGNHVHVLTHAIDCAPCFNGSGCPEMSCVRNVPVSDVLKAITVAMECKGGA